MSARSRTRGARRPVHGVLLLDKPLGLSSNQALQAVKRLLRAQKAGHTGTLDPLATGILPICLGAATKFSSLHLDADKSYQARIRLGARTDTGDADGTVVQECAVPALDARRLQAVRERFLGPQLQTPPMYSALKKDGRPLYEYARAGQQVAREPRAIDILALDLALDASDPDGRTLAMTVRCSKGTYVRTLGEDVAAALGSCGHLVSLRRLRTGGSNVDQCVGLEQLEAMEPGARERQLLPVDTLLQGHMQVLLAPAEAGRFLAGQRRRGDWPDRERVAVYGQDPHALLGIAHTRAGELIADRLLSPLEIRQMLADPVDAVDAGVAPGEHT